MQNKSKVSYSGFATVTARNFNPQLAISPQLSQSAVWGGEREANGIWRTIKAPRRLLSGPLSAQCDCCPVARAAAAIKPAYNNSPWVNILPQRKHCLAKSDGCDSLLFLYKSSAPAGLQILYGNVSQLVLNIAM